MKTLALVLAMASVAGADTVSGTVRYQDRTYNATGFTGTQLLPVRFAEFEVVRSDGTVLGSGSTLVDGTYSVVIANAGTQSIFLRVYARQNSAAINASIRTAGNAIYTAVTTPASLDTNAPITLDLDVTIASGGAGPFNLFDGAVLAFEYIASLDTPLLSPLPPLIVFWDAGSTDGTYFDGASVHIRGDASDADEFDDDVVLHEFGHFTAAHWSKDDSPGGSHSVTDQLDPRLAWSEGWATYFSSATKRLAGAALYPTPELYVDIFAVGTFSMNIETPSFSPQAITARNELAISAVLWDLTDPANELFDAMPLPVNPATEDDVWTVMESLPAATNVTLEDFFLSWITIVTPAEALATSGDPTTTGVFRARQIRYYLDPSEANNTSATATSAALPASFSQRTIFAVNDEDWFTATIPLGTLRATATNLGDGASLIIDIIAADSVTVVGTGSTTAQGTFGVGTAAFVRVRSTNQVTQLGYYDLSIVYVANLPPVISSRAATESIALQPARVSFTAASSDPDGVIARYEWDFDGDGATDYRSTEGPEATFTYDRAGTFNATLRVVDNLGDSATSSLPVSINPNGTLTGSLSVSTSSPTAPSVATATAAIPDAIVYDWDFTGDNVIDATTTSPAAAFTYREGGVFAVRVTGRDSFGRAVRIASLPFIVLAGANPPSITTFTASPDVGTLPVNATLSVTATDDSVITSYEWDIDSDGRLDAITTTPTLPWRYERVGPWTARVTCIDNTGLAASSTALVSPTQIGSIGWFVEPRGEGAIGPVTLTADLFPNGSTKTVRFQRDGVDIAGPFGVTGTQAQAVVLAAPGTLRVVVDGVAGETTPFGSGSIAETSTSKSKDVPSSMRTRFFFDDVELDFPAGTFAADTRITLAKNDGYAISMSPAVALLRPYRIRVHRTGELSTFELRWDGALDAHPVGYFSDGLLEVAAARVGRFSIVASDLGARPFAQSRHKTGCTAGAGETAGILGIVVIIAILFVLLERNVLDRRQLMLPEDTATAPGKSLKLRVIVRKDVFPLVDPPLGGVEVKLKRGEQTITARTNNQGIAEFEALAFDEGLHVLPIECGGTPDEIIVAATPKPLLIVDIDGTIARCSQFTFLFKETRHVKVMKGALEALKALQEKYQIVYLTARDRILREKTARWLAMNGFPKAPLLVRRRRYWEQKAREHKIERLKELVDVTIAAGIGDTKSDVEAYAAVGAKALHFRRVVKSWSDVATALKQ